MEIVYLRGKDIRNIHIADEVPNILQKPGRTAQSIIGLDRMSPTVFPLIVNHKTILPHAK
jgi:hypothetical protein